MTLPGLQQLMTRYFVINLNDACCALVQIKILHLKNDSRFLDPVCRSYLKSFWRVQTPAQDSNITIWILFHVFQCEAQRAAVRFEKASSAHDAAKEMVQLAEQGYKEQGIEFDQAWQEMLNHSISKV